MAFTWKDNQIYDELRDVVPGVAVTQGQAAVVNDVFGFYLTATQRTAATEEITLVYRCRQVEGPKRTGTGQAISSGEKLYYYPLTDNVSPTATGTFGTDYYFCGWAKDDASASATTVLMNFDGTRYNEDI